MVVQDLAHVFQGRLFEPHCHSLLKRQYRSRSHAALPSTHGLHGDIDFHRQSNVTRPLPQELFQKDDETQILSNSSNLGTPISVASASDLKGINYKQRDFCKTEHRPSGLHMKRSSSAPSGITIREFHMNDKTWLRLMHTTAQHESGLSPGGRVLAASPDSTWCSYQLPALQQIPGRLLRSVDGQEKACNSPATGRKSQKSLRAALTFGIKSASELPPMNEPEPEVRCEHEALDTNKHVDSAYECLPSELRSAKGRAKAALCRALPSEDSELVLLDSAFQEVTKKGAEREEQAKKKARDALEQALFAEDLRAHAAKDQVALATSTIELKTERRPDSLHSELQCADRDSKRSLNTSSQEPMLDQDNKLEWAKANALEALGAALLGEECPVSAAVGGEDTLETLKARARDALSTALLSVDMVQEKDDTFLVEAGSSNLGPQEGSLHGGLAVEHAKENARQALSMGLLGEVAPFCVAESEGKSADTDALEMIKHRAQNALCAALLSTDITETRDNTNSLEMIKERARDALCTALLSTEVENTRDNTDFAREELSDVTSQETLDGDDKVEQAKRCAREALSMALLGEVAPLCAAENEEESADTVALEMIKQRAQHALCAALSSTIKERARDALCRALLSTEVDDTMDNADFEREELSVATSQETTLDGDDKVEQAKRNAREALSMALLGDVAPLCAAENQKEIANTDALEMIKTRARDALCTALLFAPNTQEEHAHSDEREVIKELAQDVLCAALPSLEVTETRDNKCFQGERLSDATYQGPHEEETADKDDLEMTKKRARNALCAALLAESDMENEDVENVWTMKHNVREALKRAVSTSEGNDFFLEQAKARSRIALCGSLLGVKPDDLGS